LIFSRRGITIERRAVNLSHPRLLEWFTDDPADPGRLLLNDPAVRQLAAAISPKSHITDLGDVMSLNVRLDAVGYEAAALLGEEGGRR